MMVSNRYQVVRKLGEGGMGEVFLVKDEAASPTGPMALKVLRGPTPRIQELRHEFQVLSTLNHPNVVRVCDFGPTLEGDGCYFSYEYVEGTDLDAWYHGLPPAAAREALVPVIIQILRGLEYIHSRGLVHYDIKPENVLISAARNEGDLALGKESEPTVKIVDFGLASPPIDGVATAPVKGTLNYMAPEILRGERVDRRADLYSLGVTLYRLLTRSLPYSGEREIDVIRGHLAGHPRPLPAGDLDPGPQEGTRGRAGRPVPPAVGVRDCPGRAQDPPARPRRGAALPLPRHGHPGALGHAAGPSRHPPPDAPGRPGGRRRPGPAVVHPIPADRPPPGHHHRAGGLSPLSQRPGPLLV